MLIFSQLKLISTQTLSSQRGQLFKCIIVASLPIGDLDF